MTGAGCSTASGIPDYRADDGRWKRPAPVTWQAFADQIRHLALFLAGEGLSSAEAVAFLGPNRVEWMSAALGVQSAGGAVVPIYPASTAEQIAYIVEHSDAKLLFVDTEALLERVFERWSAYPHVRRVVCLDDRLSPMEIAARVNARGGQAPDPSEIERKFVSWSIALGSGTSGGTLAPLFTIGGALGALLGASVDRVLPQAHVDAHIAALVGMAAIFAGASRALLASAVFAFETTLQPVGLLPLLGGCAASYLASSLLMRNSLMTEKIAVFAPMPIASTHTEIKVKPGCFINIVSMAPR